MSVLVVSVLGLALLVGAVADASSASRTVVLGVDAGTESLRAVLFDKDGGNLVCSIRVHQWNSVS